MQANKEDAIPTDIATKYVNHAKIVDEAKKEYLNAFKNMLDMLKPEHLDPFTKILEREHVHINAATLIDSIKRESLKILISLNDQLFQQYDLPNKLITLEMLKEEFKDHQDAKWDMVDAAPEALALSVRMKLKEISLKFLKKQIETQNKQLEEARRVNKAHREQLQDIKNKRIVLQNMLDKNVEQFKNLKPKLLELACKINSEPVDDN